MVTDDRCILIGDIHCVNCGRLLGELARNPETGKLRLRAAAHRQEMLVAIERGRTLRCIRCNGRAFVEPVAHPSDAEAKLAAAPAPERMIPAVAAA